MSLYIKNSPMVPKYRPAQEGCGTLLAAVPHGCASRWLIAASARSTVTTVENSLMAPPCAFVLCWPDPDKPVPCRGAQGRPVLVTEEKEQGGVQQQVNGDCTGPCCCQPVSACLILMRHSAVPWGFSVGRSSWAGWEDTLNVTAYGEL